MRPNIRSLKYTTRNNYYSFICNLLEVRREIGKKKGNM